jgi:hypothetical protein
MSTDGSYPLHEDVSKQTVQTYLQDIFMRQNANLSRDSSVSMVTELRVGRPGFDS